MFTTGFIDAAACEERQLLFALGARERLHSPMPAYEGQNLAPLLHLARLRSGQAQLPIMSPERIDLITVRNGWFSVGDRLDGIIITEDRRMIRQTATFSEVRQDETEFNSPRENTIFDEVFVGFDAAWTNWFHWLCFAVARSAFAARFLARRCTIALPDRDTREGTADFRFGRATWRQSLDAFGLSDRTTLLPPGLYHAKAIHFLWTTPPGRATQICLLPEFQNLFRAVRRHQPVPIGGPRRILISRDRGPHPRLTADESALLDRVAEKHGFTKVFFEEMDFAGQRATIANAEAVVAVHGAGLTNLLFASDRTKVLEINMPQDEGEFLRPWFWLLAQTRRLPYRFLNPAAGELTEPRIEDALRSLGIA